MDERTIARFWSHVDKSAGPDGCWLWTAALNINGYGKAKVAGMVQAAHRLSWEMDSGAHPGTACVCHRCDTPACVNPAHLFLGSHADNMRDMAAKGRAVSLRGESSSSSKLTSQQVLYVLDARRAGLSGRAIARSLGVHHSTVDSILAGKSWTHVARQP